MSGSAPFKTAGLVIEARPPECAAPAALKQTCFSLSLCGPSIFKNHFFLSSHNFLLSFLLGTLPKIQLKEINTNEILLSAVLVFVFVLK